MTKKVLSLSEFTALTLPEQLDVLQQEGAYVGKRSEGEQDRILYQLGSYYVEIRYAEYRKTIASIEVSADLAILQPYLDQIRLRGL